MQRRTHSLAFAAGGVLIATASLLGVELPYLLQLVLLALLVVMVGLPHGALDPLLARAAGLAPGTMGMTRFLGLYVLQLTLALLLWWWQPELALSLFLLMSAIHFADDWTPELPLWSRALAGSGLILAPLLFHPQEVAGLFGVLSSATFGQWLTTALQPLALLVVTGLAGAGLISVARRQPAGLELLTVLLLAWALTPVLFFVVYFCGLHSPRHLIDSFRELQMPGRVTLGVCLALTALTVIGALLLAQTQPQWDREEALLRLVFVGLAVLTVPHMTLLWRVKQQNRLNPGN
ncbi:MAG: beta-carotene 15,15'-dioxygenase, Brp/Blh family [Xanthomonadales bacterium]|nr:beta-carotene 15,15'-dioxygenase, Brp/Blh family [Xanthomonadales bacterium]